MWKCLYWKERKEITRHDAYKLIFLIHTPNSAFVFFDWSYLYIIESCSLTSDTVNGSNLLSFFYLIWCTLTTKVTPLEALYVSSLYFECTTHEPPPHLIETLYYTLIISKDWNYGSWARYRKKLNKLSSQNIEGIRNKHGSLSQLYMCDFANAHTRTEKTTTISGTRSLANESIHLTSSLNRKLVHCSLHLLSCQ